MNKREMLENSPHKPQEIKEGFTPVLFKDGILYLLSIGDLNPGPIETEVGFWRTYPHKGMIAVNVLTGKGFSFYKDEKSAIECTKRLLNVGGCYIIYNVTAKNISHIYNATYVCQEIRLDSQKEGLCVLYGSL